MPLKLCIGLSRKVGQPDFGSLGASCSVELELESCLLDRDREAFQQRIRALYALCTQAVEEELARQQRPGPATHRNGHAAQQCSAHANGAARRGLPSRAERPATTSQIRAVYAMASRRGLDLTGLLAERFGIDRAEELSVADASTLIEELQQADVASTLRS